MYHAGDGCDVIDEGQDAVDTDLISLRAGFIPTDLTLKHIGVHGQEVRLHIQGMQGSIYLKNQLASSG